ncbi:MAG: hypothetical protein ABFR02_10700 [Campylobacterota bacterium]
MFEDIIGTLGVAVIVITYFLLQVERMRSDDLLYSLLNIIGSVMILFSILKNWNFASFLIEIFWILISLIGVYKFVKRRKKERELL